MHKSRLSVFLVLLLLVTGVFPSTPAFAGKKKSQFTTTVVSTDSDDSGGSAAAASTPTPTPTPSLVEFVNANMKVTGYSDYRTYYKTLVSSLSYKQCDTDTYNNWVAWADSLAKCFATIAGWYSTYGQSDTSILTDYLNGSVPGDNSHTDGFFTPVTAIMSSFGTDNALETAWTGTFMAGYVRVSQSGSAYDVMLNGYTRLLTAFSKSIENMHNGCSSVVEGSNSVQTASDQLPLMPSPIVGSPYSTSQSPIKSSFLYAKKERVNFVDVAIPYGVSTFSMGGIPNYFKDSGNSTGYYFGSSVPSLPQGTGITHWADTGNQPSLDSLKNYAVGGVISVEGSFQSSVFNTLTTSTKYNGSWLNYFYKAAGYGTTSNANSKITGTARYTSTNPSKYVSKLTAELKGDGDTSNIACVSVTESLVNSVSDYSATFYMSAVQGFFTHTIKNGGFLSKGMACGQLFDALFYNKSTKMVQVVHFIYMDQNGDANTLLSKDNGSGWYSDTDGGGSSVISGYGNLASLIDGHLLELWGWNSNGSSVASSFKNKYGISTGALDSLSDGAYHLVYYRLYPYTIKQVLTGDVVLVSNDTAQGATGTITSIFSSVDTTGSSWVSSSGVVADFSDDSARSITLPDGSALTPDEKLALEEWTITAGKTSGTSKLVTFFRRAFMLFGLLLMLWGMLAFFFYWFDRTNTILPISLLWVISFGFLKTADDDESATFDNGAVHSRCHSVSFLHLVKIVCIAECTGLVFVTGLIYAVLKVIVHLALKIREGLCVHLIYLHC